MAHPYASHKTLHTERVSKMLGGYAKELGGPKANRDYEPKNPMLKHGEAAMPGAKTKIRGDKFARGGKVKGKTNININIAPPADAGAAMPNPAVAPAAPPMAAMAPPPMAPAGPPPGAMPPPGMHPPGANRGGRFARGGKVKDGSAFKEGIKNGTKVSHSKQGDGVTQKKGDMHRPPVITKKEGGRIKDFSQDIDKIKMPKKDFSTPARKPDRDFSEHVHMETVEHAAGGGKGRLEKNHMRARKHG